MTVANSGLQKALVTGLLNWNNVCVPEKRKKWTSPQIFVGFLPLFCLFVQHTVCFALSAANPKGKKSL